MWGVEVFDIIFRTYVLLDFELTTKISVNFPFFKNCKILVFKIIPCEFVPRIYIFLFNLKRYRLYIYWKLVIFQSNHYPLGCWTSNGTCLSEAVVPMCFVEKVFLEISQNSQENTCARLSSLIKLLALGSGDS